MGTVALRVSQASKSYGRGKQARPALRDLDLEVHEAELLAVLGPSGGGKSTLLKAIAGLEPLDFGRIEWVGDLRESVTGVVFQQPLLLPWLTVRQNVRLGGRFRAHRDRFSTSDSEALLDRLGLSDLADAYPDELSGGQAQRVGIARALALRPRFLLLDEPFSALDPATRQALREWLRDIVTAHGLTAVLVTHDVDEALSIGDRIALLGGAEQSGRIVRVWDNQPGGDPASSRLRAELLDRYDSTVPVGATAGET